MDLLDVLLACDALGFELVDGRIKFLYVRWGEPIGVFLLTLKGCGRPVGFAVDDCQRFYCAVLGVPARTRLVR